LTTAEYISKLNGQVSHLKDGIIVAIAAQDTHSMMLERIFEQGKKTDGSDIGQYNTSNELYVNPKNAPKNFPAKGKNGDAKFSDGKPHKTGFFESYKEYRSTVGRQSTKVDLTMTGLLKSDFSRAVVKVNNFNYTSSVSTERNKKIIEGMEEKFGKIFGLTEAEKQNFLEVLKYESLRILQSA
jgi:hypothetical protein